MQIHRIPNWKPGPDKPRRRRRKTGINGRPGLSQPILDLITLCYRMGIGYVATAQLAGISETAVKTHARRLGLKGSGCGRWTHTGVPNPIPRELAAAMVLASLTERPPQAQAPEPLRVGRMNHFLR